MEVEDKLTIALGFVTLILFGALMVWVAGQIAPASSNQRYIVNFSKPIHGLEKNATVTMQGIPIGRVDKLTRIEDSDAGYISKVEIVITEPGVVLFGDGEPVLRRVGNLTAASRDGLSPGDRLLRLWSLGPNGAATESSPLTARAEAAASLEAAARGAQGYVLRVERGGELVDLAFGPGSGSLKVTLSAASAAPIVASVGAPRARASQGLRVRDRIVAIGGHPVALVHDAEREMRELYRTMDRQTLYTLVVQREGTESPVVVPMSGSLGRLDLVFWNLGTRATLESNLVTGIKKVELSGGQPLTYAGAGMREWNKLTLGSTIPAQEEDFISRISTLVEERLPPILHRVDSLLVEANRAGSEVTEGVREMRQILADARRWTKEGGKLDTFLGSSEDVIADVRRWTKEGGQVDKLLADIEAMTKEDGRLDKSIADLKKRVNEVADSATKTLDRLNAQLADDGDLRKTLANLEAWTRTGEGSTKARFDALISRIDKTVADLDKQLLADDKIAKTVDHLNYAIRRDLRSALTQINESMQVFKQTLIQMQSNPDSIFLGKRRGK